MTISKAIEKLTNKKELNVEQQKLRVSLIDLKVKYGGGTLIENLSDVENIIEFGSRQGK